MIIEVRGFCFVLFFTNSWILLTSKWKHFLSWKQGYSTLPVINDTHSNQHYVVVFQFNGKHAIYTLIIVHSNMHNKNCNVVKFQSSIKSKHLKRQVTNTKFYKSFTDWTNICRNKKLSRYIKNYFFLSHSAICAKVELYYQTGMWTTTGIVHSSVKICTSWNYTIGWWQWNWELKSTGRDRSWTGD